MDRPSLSQVQNGSVARQLQQAAIISHRGTRYNASFAQQRIWYDEIAHRNSSVGPTTSNVVIPLTVELKSMPIERIHFAINTLLKQYAVLRTAVYFDEISDQLMQEVQPVGDNNSYSFQLTRKVAFTPRQARDLLDKESVHQFSQLDRGLVVRCHLVRRGDDYNEDDLHQDDMIIFVFHPIAFDFNSTDVFMKAFQRAYKQLAVVNTNGLQYIDFSMYENQQAIDLKQGSKMNPARQFWSGQILDYSQNKKCSTSLAAANQINSLSAGTRSFLLDLNLDLATTQVNPTLNNSTSMFHMGLGCFLTFLYQMNSYSTTDLCVACLMENRPLIEMKSMIGPFTNILPYRIEATPSQSSESFLRNICQFDDMMQRYAHFPYQLFLEASGTSNLAKIPFHFRYYRLKYISSTYGTSNDTTEDELVNLYNNQIWLHGRGAISNDLTLTMIYNENVRRVFCLVEYSLDRYDGDAAKSMTQYFERVFTHLLDNNSAVNQIDDTLQQIANASSQRMIHNEQLSGKSLADNYQSGQIEAQSSIVTQSPTTNYGAGYHLQQHSDIHQAMASISDKCQQLTECDVLERSALFARASTSLPLGEDVSGERNTDIEKTIAIIWKETIDKDRFNQDNRTVTSNERSQSLSIFSPSLHRVELDSGTTSQIPTSTNFYSLGGDSLSMVKVYRQYQSVFDFDAEALSIRSLFHHNTIAEQAKLLKTMAHNSVKLKQWHPLHIENGVASFAQERIFLDERVRFTGQIAINNELIALRAVHGALSTDYLLKALRSVMRKHKILRTSLVFNYKDHTVNQSISDNHLTFTFAPAKTFKNENELFDIIAETTIDPDLFDLSTGLVFQCQIVKNQNSDTQSNHNLVTKSDVLIIGFHRAVFDEVTLSVFLNALSKAYYNNAERADDNELLQYVDYSVHERLIDMKAPREFWRSHLDGYNADCHLYLPVDRHCSSTKQRTGYASVAEISLDKTTSISFLDYATSHQITPFQLSLAVYYAFLFKLSQGQHDLCISCLNANRHRPDLQNMSGMFVATSPCRIQIDSNGSFDELAQHVREHCLSIMEHSQYPLQHILADLHLDQTKASFMDVMFHFVNISSRSKQVSINGARFEQLPLAESSEVAKFDFMLKLTYDSTRADENISFRLICSRDLFDETTVMIAVRRLKQVFEQLFPSELIDTKLNTHDRRINKLSLILPTEGMEIQNTILCRQPTVLNEAPASYAQTRRWNQEQALSHSGKSPMATCNMPFFYKLSSQHTLSVARLQQALQLLLVKHLSLRTSLVFHQDTKRLMQKTTDLVDVSKSSFRFIESSFQTDEQLDDIMTDEQYNPLYFDLAEGLVFRCHLVYHQHAPVDGVLSDKDAIIFNFHHAVFDLPSMNIFLRDLHQAYTTGQLLDDDSTALRYLDYAVIERQMPMAAASMFWLDVLYDYNLAQPLSLPYDRHRLSNEYSTSRGRSVSFEFGQDLSREFLTHASACNVSLQQLSLASCYAFLFKLTSGELDLCVGMNVDNRYRDELQSVLGLFENVIPLRCRLDPRWSFHQLVDSVREMEADCVKYSYFPVERILSAYSSDSKAGFLDSRFGFQSNSENGENEVMIGNAWFLRMRKSTIDNELRNASDFLFSIQYEKNTDQLSCTLHVSQDLFHTATVHNMSQRFHSILQQLLAPAIQELREPISELLFILPSEKILMQSVNNTEASYSSASCIHHEFICQVERHPQKLAVELDEQSLTYGELLHFVQVFSSYLLSTYDVVQGEIVCQCVERSVSMVIGMMSITMVGAVYCPLSPRDPEHRLHTLVQQTRSRLVLVHPLTEGKFQRIFTLIDMQSIILDTARHNVKTDSLLKIRVSPESIAYIIFTSGSTGTPKAAQIRHRNVTQCMHSMVLIDAVNKEDTVVQIARCSFDVHVLDIMGTLIVGGSLIMLRPDGILDLDYFTTVLKKKHITYIQAVPSLLRTFFTFFKDTQQMSAATYLRSVCSSGEPFPTELMTLLTGCTTKECKIWNLYGPAETIICTFQQVDPTLHTTLIPIGLVMPNYRCLVLDTYLQSSVINQEGELYVGGVGVFAGYLGRDDLTANMLAHIDHEIFYKTGDLVRADSRGLLHYISRKDYQVKLHGQRIELGEIERSLLNTPISACIVIKWGEDHLIAYVQSSNVNEQQLREHCQSRLPAYMIPSQFIILEQLPLNANGKIDRKRLPAPQFSLNLSTNSNISYAMPRNELELHIHSLWCKILSHERIPIHANFFDIGGHSLLLVQLYFTYKMTLNFHVDTGGIAKLSMNPTIANHADLIQQTLDKEEEQPGLSLAPEQSDAQTADTKSRTHSSYQDISVPQTNVSSRYDPFPVTDVQQAYLIGRKGFIELGRVSCFAYDEYDLSPSFNIRRLENALNHLIQYHEAFRIIFPSDKEQKILDKVPYYTLSTLELSDDETVKEELLERRRKLSHQIRPADQWPLFDIQVTRFKIDNEYRVRLHVGFDILILDYWSMNLILQQLNQLYHNPTFVLSTLNFSFRDYVLIEKQLKNATSYKNDKQYWIDRVNTFPLGPKLPLKRMPEEIHVQRHHNSQKILDQAVWQKLRERISDHALTPAGFLASTYAIVLSKWSENKHFGLNLPVFNRLLIHPEINDIAGDFTTVLPLEINLTASTTFHQLFKSVQEQLWNDLEHMSYNGISFIRDLMHAYKTKEVALPYVFTCGIDVGGTKRRDSDENIFFDQLPVYSISQTPQVFLDHIVYENNGCLVANWMYVEDLFSSELIDDMHTSFMSLLNQLASSNRTWQQPILISLPSEQQERRLTFNETQWQPNARPQLLHSLVIHQAEQTPTAPAILSSQMKLTYKQLMNQVYSLAYHLQHRHTVHSNELIAILMRKGWEQVVACLAVLISGSAYLPLDIDAPYERLCALIEETNVRVILTQSHCQHTFPHLTTVAVDTLPTTDEPVPPFPLTQKSPTDLAYIIYTSGSTGKPKGVMISHQAVVNTILDINSRLEVSTNDRIFALSHLNFDLSVYDIFGMLIGGGTIVIPDHEDYKNPKHWFDMITEYRVTIWNSVPMLMQMLLEHLRHDTNIQHQLRNILLSGDWIPLSLPKAIGTIFGDQTTITSLGGATEASIWSIAHTLPKDIPSEWKSIPYGKPLRNQHYYVYDAHLDDCPDWVSGELYIGGLGLADGYWNDQVKTQSSFIVHPQTSERLYRTGDYGRFVPNGYIEFMGRKDLQVKVHGHRIELGEIEYHLQQHSDVHQAIVSVDSNSQKLIGYVMPEKYSVSSQEYELSEVVITDPVERTNFKLGRHSIRHQPQGEVVVSLRNPKLTETLINMCYARKSYRQFTNERIDKSTVEYLLKQVHKECGGIDEASPPHFEFDALSALLAVLTSINDSDQPLPKYRYASAGSLYPVQVYVELPEHVSNISPGLYYHNPDTHTLELVDNYVDGESTNARIHLVGRSSAIAPLYGKRLGADFCVLETGYMMGLLEREGSQMGLTILRDARNESLKRNSLDVHEDDTHYCFEILSREQYMPSDERRDYFQCVIYMKCSEYNKNEWFTYDNGHLSVIAVNTATDITVEEMPLLFDDDDDTKAIFYGCQCAIFFIGQSKHTLDIGRKSHLLMENCLEMNIGLCPIGALTSFPKSIYGILGRILNNDNQDEKTTVLHTLLVGKISDEQKHDRTISKVKTMSKWNETLKKYLSAKLPAYMVPSYWTTVSTFPLNANGKIDRKALPEVSRIIIQQEDAYNAPSNALENMIAEIWQQVLYADDYTLQHNDLKSTLIASLSNESSIPMDSAAVNSPQTDVQNFLRISATSSFFSLGGDSLALVQIYRQYQSIFHFESEAITVRPFFEHDTIAEHAKLLEALTVATIPLKQWHTLFINAGIASFAQERIFLDESVRFASNTSIYNELAVLRVVDGSLSVDRLTRALRSVVNKHKILRTSLIFDDSDSTLNQFVNDKYLTLTLASDQMFTNDDELHAIIYQRTADTDLFDLSTGRVFYCQILRYRKASDESNDTKFVREGDVLVIGFHHAAADRSTFSIFFHDLSNAYNNRIEWSEDDEFLQYIDYTVHERLIDMAPSREFWRSHLDGHNVQRRLSLPVDRHRLSAEQRSGYASVVRISFDKNLTSSFINFASSRQITPFQLGLATFYVFLFKLTHGESDICVSCLNANRYRPELQNMIGMFVSTLPYAVQLDPSCSFNDLIQYVRQTYLSILEHSHYPLQNILKDCQLNPSSAMFLEILFDFIVASSDVDQLFRSEVILKQISSGQSSEVAKFDFKLAFVYNPALDDKKLSFRISCSRDLFADATVLKITQRFQYLLEQLFSLDSTVGEIVSDASPICKLTLILPEEVDEIQTQTFFRQLDIGSEGMVFYVDNSNTVKTCKDV